MKLELHRACVALEVPLGKRQKVLDVFRWVLARVQAQTGLVRGVVCEDTDGAGRLHFVTEWHSRPDLEKFIRSELFSATLTAAELCDSSPVMWFDEICDRRELDYVAAVRVPELRDRESQRAKRAEGGSDGTQP